MTAEDQAMEIGLLKLQNMLLRIERENTILKNKLGKDRLRRALVRIAEKTSGRNDSCRKLGRIAKNALRKESDE